LAALEDDLSKLLHARDTMESIKMAPPDELIRNVTAKEQEIEAAKRSRGAASQARAP